MEYNVTVRYHTNGLWLRDMEYIGGDVYKKQGFDIDLLSAKDLKDKLMELSIIGKNIRDVIVLEEGCDLRTDLRRIINDDDIRDLCANIVLKNIKLIDVSCTLEDDVKIWCMSHVDSPIKPRIVKSCKLSDGNMFVFDLVNASPNHNKKSLASEGFNVSRSPRCHSTRSPNVNSPGFKKLLNLYKKEAAFQREQAEIVVDSKHVNKARAKRVLLDEMDEGNNSCERVPVGVYMDPYEDEEDSEYNDYGSDVSDSEDDDYLHELDGEKYEDEVDRIREEIRRDQEAAKKTLDVDGKPLLYVGKSFCDATEARRFVDRYALTYGYSLKIKHSEPGRLIYECIKGCPFYLRIFKTKHCPGLSVRTLKEKHDCYWNMKNPRITTQFVIDYFKEKIRENPTMKTLDMVKDFESNVKCYVLPSMCKKARRMIIHQIYGNYIDEFNWLQSYCDEIRRSNPGTRVQLDICGNALQEGRRQFRRVFICFKACRDGWTTGCRPIIGLDGCFLKSKTKGQLLAAIGLDSNDKWFPVAWAVVDRETKANWEWFLLLLKEELELDEGDRYTVISDMQKGLVPAISNVLPNMEHRFCARHIHANWSKRFKGGELRKWFWICAWSTFDEEFKDNYKLLGQLSDAAAQDLADRYPMKTWVRAYFSGRCKSSKVENNFTESFNARILQARYKPIIRLLEDVRILVMERTAKKSGKEKTWINNWSPKAYNILTENKKLGMKCTVVLNGDNGFEVSYGRDRHTVNLETKRCSCREWDIIGIPCPYSCCAYAKVGLNPDQDLSIYYHRVSYESTYQPKIQPVKGQRFWHVEDYPGMEPPPVPKQVGRPKLNRRKQIDEQPAQHKRDPLVHLPKYGEIQACSKCGRQGHNARTCHKHNKEPQPTPSSHCFKAGATSRTPHVEIPKTMSQPLGTQTSVNHNSTFQKPDFTLKNASKGCGIMYDDDGAVEFHTGRTIEDDDEDLPDPVGKNLPIPEEAEIRNERTRTVQNTGDRRIEMRGNGVEVPDPIDLPYHNKYNLRWKGKRSLSSRQLVEMMTNKRQKKGNEHAAQI